MHYKRPSEHPFTRAERNHVVCLFGGLTRRHDRLLMAGMEGLGYRVACVPTPTKTDYHTGREFCNPGMCNPAYFTIGALINTLRRLRDEQGLSPEAINRDYLFITAGSRGPCRFGMYEAEYRLALKNAGFDGFRVLTFQQKGGLNQSSETAGFAIDAALGQMLMTAVMLGDLFNDLANQIRPYEVHRGETDRVFAGLLDRAGDWLRNRTRRAPQPGWIAKGLEKFLRVPGLDLFAVQRILDQVLGRDHLDLLTACAERIDAIEVDYLRPKPVCKVIGEAWAKMTEGDGNFRMFAFLEAEGAEVLTEPLLTWANYMLDLTKRNALEAGRRSDWAQAGLRHRLCARFQSLRRGLTLHAAHLLVNREYNRMRAALNNKPHPQIDQGELRRLADPYYNSRLTGGEGHLEVAKTIYCTVHHLAHMILSLKPFGCMPSTQSDGVQAMVAEQYARKGVEIHFLPIETSGEGEINAYSRVQMALSDAKETCAREFEQCVAETGYSLEALRRFCLETRAMRRPLMVIPHRDGIVGRAAQFAAYCASQIPETPDTPAIQPSPVPVHEWSSVVETKPERISS